jgi:bacteriocin-like protein
MVITKCSIWALKVSEVTVAAEALGQCARTATDGSALAWMEKIMSKTKDTSKTRELTEDELNHVSGGSFNYGHIEWTYTKQKPDGTSAGNVAAKWNVARGAAA